MLGNGSERQGSQFMKIFSDSALFQLLKPYIEIEIYDRDGGHVHPRRRIELSKRAPSEVVALALAFETPCAACGEPIHCWRARAGGKRGGTAHLYFAAACPLSVNVGCSRGYAASSAYASLCDAVAA